MGLQINSNATSIFARRQTTQTANRLNNNLQRLASGLRINRAADDAAGLAIAETFRASIRQLNTESRGLQTGSNLAATAEGGLSAQGEIVGRIRELAVQAANGTLNDDQRAAINVEAQELQQELDNIGQNTEFNGIGLLDGSTGPVTVDTTGDIQVDLQQSDSGALGLGGLDLSTQAGAQAAIAATDAAATQINQNRANLGASQNRIQSAIETRDTQALNEIEAESRIRDLDVARAAIEQARNEVLLQGGLSSIIQGNLQSQTALRLLGG